MKYIIFIFIVFNSFNCVASDKPQYLDIAGKLKIWGKKTDSEELPGFSIFLKGKSAEELFNQLNVEAIYNECYDDGTITKYLDTFECSFSKVHGYSCSVGVGLKEKKLFFAESC